MHRRRSHRQGGAHLRLPNQLGRRSSRNHLIHIFVLSVALSAGLVFGALGQDILLVGGHTFEYLGVAYNEDGTSTWAYSVTSGSKPSLIHWTIELDPSLDESAVVSASETYEVGDDPKTGLYGLKFDEGYENEETREVIFTLDAWYEIDNVRVGTKAGGDVQVGEFLAGPGPGTVEGNQAPVANDDSATTDENTSVGIDIAANDTDADGTIDRTTIAITSSPGRGTLSVHPDSGVATYLPDPGSCGDDGFSYTIEDDEGAVSNEATVTVTVLCNDPPLAIDDLYNAQEGGTLEIGAPGVLANDVDAPGSPLTAILVTDTDHGTLTLRSDGSLTYVHDGGETSADAFTYEANDGVSDSNVASVSIIINPANDPPQATYDAQSTDEDVPTVIDVLANDSDPDGDTLFVDSVDSPEDGTASNNGADITYTPDPDFHGTDSFDYRVSDGNGGTSTATVAVTVLPVNDAPTAQDDSAFTDEDKKVTIAVLDNDDDPDGDDLDVETVSQPASGTVSIQGKKVRYTPADGFHGIVTFTYAASDGNGGLATATVTVAVATVNNPPVAEDDDVFTNEDTPIAIPVLANDSDPDGDPLAIESISQPLHGTSVPSGASMVYTPDPNFEGEDTFTYTIADGNGVTATATVTVSVEPVNDAPAAQDDSSTTNEDTPVTIFVLVNDSDPDGGALRIESVTQPANGTVSNNGSDVTYGPGPGFGGVDTFSYAVSDGRGGSATATVTVVVNAVNDPPVAQDDSATTGQGSLVSIPVLDNDSDPDGDFLLVESFSAPENGTVLNTRTGISYIPEPGFQGVDTFTYTVSDGNGGNDTATVTVSVSSVNEAPLAREDTANTDEGITLTIPVLLNDLDLDGDALRVESLSKPENGTAVNLGDGIEYTPNPDFSGVDQFTYTVSDGRGGTSSAGVFIAVAGVNDKPIAQDDSGTTNPSEPISIPVLANDEDPDGDALFIASVSDPAGGSVRIDGGMLVYTPDPDYTRTDTFTYTVSDGRGSTDSATVTVGVLAGGAGGAADAASCEGKVIISEIAWAGTLADPRDEWIELRNLGTTPVDLSGWVLRWRRTHPTTADELVWRTVALTGVLGPAPTAACDELAVDVQPAVRFDQESSDSVAWRVTGGVDDTETGYYVLERKHDATVEDLSADLVYDTDQMLALDLSNHGEIVMLVDDLGVVIDTANASSLGRGGWVAGSSTTFGTMERIDPLGPDVAENWHTNMGIVIHGDDADGRPLRATPGATNSPVLEDLEAFADVEATTIRAGETPQVSFDLSRADRRNTGWPWISVVRPGFAGQGGAAELSRYSFAGGYGSGDEYVLDIGTGGLAPGSYVFWIVYGEGEALLVPITVTP